MKHTVVFAPSFALLTEEKKLEGKKIVALFGSVMDDYYRGNPFAFVKIYKQDNFTYIDSGTFKRRNSVEEMAEFFKLIDGKVIAEKDYRIEDVAVQFTDDVAVLSLLMFVRALDFDFEWNVTEVFQKNKNGDYQIIHSHYSYVRPMDMKGYPIVKL